MIKEEYRFLNRLSDINNNTGVKFLHRAACPGSHCPMHMALATIRGMEGVSSLVVGMPECGYYSRYVAVTPFGKNGELHYVYELDSNEVVFGCRKGIKNALLQMSKEGAKVIVIILTCVPALIGEDMEAIIEELDSVMDTKAVFIDSAHFKRNGYQSGLSDTLEQLVSLTKVNRESEKAKKVNILGFSRGEEYSCFKSILAENGYAVEEYAHSIPMDKMNNLAEGQINIVMNTKMIKAAKLLYKKHKIPYICLGDRYRWEDITKGYKEIFDLLQIKDANTLLRGKDFLKDYINSAVNKCTGVSFIATYPEFDTLAVTLFLTSLGMIPELLHVEEYDENSKFFKEEINALGQDPYITYITDNTRVMEVFKENSEFLSLGSCLGINQDRVIEDVSLRTAASLLGFERSTELISLILEK